MSRLQDTGDLERTGHKLLNLSSTGGAGYMAIFFFNGLSLLLVLILQIKGG